ncbi:TPA: ornithine carbamoyltransferase [Candidatus Bathyarchaeota archaeon]|nr:ornithine carbamoyltransferase [Candidatus Bathyarchaeota archaeon]
MEILKSSTLKAWWKRFSRPRLARELKGRDFLTLKDFTAEELQTILNLSLKLEKSKFYLKPLKGKSLVMIFQKPSTRTRVSFEAAIRQLGGWPITLGWGEMQLGRGETVADTAKTLERYADGIIARVFRHGDLEELANNASIPVINALSDLYHPCQALSDILTIRKHFGRLKGLKLAWVGDGDNVCHSLLLACSKLGLNMSVACPEGFEPKKEVLDEALKEAKRSGSIIEVVREPTKAVFGADVIYTDVFVSMGLEAERERRIKAFLPRYQVTSTLFKHAKPACIFMHCLPAHRGEEVVDEVIDGPRSVVWEQAENRLHLQKGLLAALFPLF